MRSDARTTATVTPAYGMRPVGGFGIRGFRVHCGECGHLSNVLKHHNDARNRAHVHRCAHA